jgi:hypothetical protein
MHPLKLEMDEAQDYPEPGWVELGETLKYGDEDATWRSHGVSRGVRDRYYKQTQPESGWYVHRWTAMHRPDWTAEERAAKSELYGSRDHPDYRRNILGLHGDAQSALFVLSRLMQCVDNRPESDYNENVYTHIRISAEKVADSGLDIVNLLRFPESHKRYTRFWAGMDVGMTNHPSEILIFAEDDVRPAADATPGVRLKLLTRVHLERIGSSDQRKVMEAIYEFYRPKGFGMDRTGLGLPIWSEITEMDNKGFVNTIRPYNFSENIVVGYDDPGSTPVYYDDEPNGKPIKANVLEYSSDMLRVLVDQKRLLLPWDVDLLREFQGQTYTISKSSTDAYGRKKFNAGKFHALDAARMAVLAHQQEFLNDMKTVVRTEPVLDRFVSPF